MIGKIGKHSSNHRGARWDLKAVLGPQSVITYQQVVDLRTIQGARSGGVSVHHRSRKHTYTVFTLHILVNAAVVLWYSLYILALRMRSVYDNSIIIG